MANSKPCRKTSQSIDEIGGIYCNICKCTQQKKYNFDRHYRTHKVESDIIVYTCLECFKEIPSYASFRQHCYQHTIKKKTICHQCQRSFSKTQVLVDHLKNIHGLCTYSCPAPCNQTFNNLKDFKAHTEKHKQDNAKQCQTCKTNLPDLNAAEKHIDDHTEHAYSCPICNTQFPNKDAAPKHLLTHFENETLNLQALNEPTDSKMMRNPIPVGCSICKTSFKNRQDFETHHLADHGENKVYGCGICWKTFTDYTMLSNHSYNHVVKGKFKCDMCEKSFCRLHLLVVHMETVHSGPDTGKAFPCAECELEFSTGKGLKAHLLDCHGISYQICPHPGCGMIFSSPTALVFHQMEHKEPSEKRCKTCGLPFKSLLACFRHMSIHKQIKFTCPICSRKYSAKCLALTHIKQHYQAPMHVCIECSKSYILKSRLLEHMKTHKKPNICTYCQKHFPSKASLNDHINVHTKQTPYECWVCHKRFSAASSWRKHMKNIHNKSTKKSEMLLEGNISNNATKDNQISKTKPASDETASDETDGKINNTENNIPDLGSDETDKYFNKKRKNTSNIIETMKTFDHNVTNELIHFESNDSSIMTVIDAYENDSHSNEENINVNNRKDTYLLVDGQVVNETNCFYIDSQRNNVRSDDINGLNKESENIMFNNIGFFGEEDDYSLNVEADKYVHKGEIIKLQFENNNCYDYQINHVGTGVINGQITENNFENSDPNGINIYTNDVSNQVNENMNMPGNNQIINSHYNIGLYANGPIMENNNIVTNGQGANKLQVFGSIFPKQSEVQTQNINMNEQIANFQNINKKYNDGAGFVVQNIFGNTNTDLKTMEAVNININSLMAAVSDSNDCNSDETPIDEDENIIMEIGALTEDLLMNPPQPPPSALPLDYGPDFVSNTSVDTYDYGNHVVYLNDSVYPHVDPHLTTKPTQVGYNQHLGYNNPQIVNPLGYQTILPFTEFVGQYNVINPAI